MSGWNRRTVLAGLAAPILAGCSSDPDSDTNVLTSALTSTLTQSVNPFSSGQSVDIKQVAAIPYATIGIRIDRSAQGILVLGSAAGGQYLWTSSAHIALVTISGRIVTTAGFEHNLTNTAFDGPDPLAGRNLDQLDGASVTRTVDLADIGLYGATIHSRFRMDGPANIEILGARIKTIHAVEECRAPATEWEFTNDYWMDPHTGLVWRSAQTVHPKLGILEIETLRPPAR